MKYLLVLIFVGFFLIIKGQNTPIVIHKTEQTFHLDGQLNDEIWEDAQSFHFTEFNPVWGKADSLTSMYVTFDDKNLYIAFQANEPQPQKIINRSLIRDRWYGDDYVSFHIDPNLTKVSSFVFSIFPLGSRFDMAVSNDAIPLGNSTFNLAYDMIWKAKTQITTTGWTAECSIPLSNLRFVKNEQGQIVAAISGLRSQNYLNRTTTSPKLPQEARNAIETPSLKQPIIFQGLKPRKQLQISPYFLANSNNKYELNPSNIYEKQSKRNLEVGLDIRYGISPQLTLDLSYNTDFAQVEIDDQIINIGDRVNIFLPEKRKFFQEQAGLFDFSLGTSSQLFYSRTIGVREGQLTPIIGGARLTGTIAGAEVGLLSMQSKSSIINESDTLASENFSVLRIRKKVLNKRSFIGLMGTNRIRDNYFNTAIGVDGVFHLKKNHLIISSWATSIEKEEQNNYHFADNSRFSLLFTKRQQKGSSYTVAYEFSGQQFQPGMGFLLREQHQNFYANFGYGKFNNDRKEDIFNYQKWTIINSDVYLKPDFSDVITWYNRSTWRGSFFSGNELSIFGQIQYEFLESPIHYTDKVRALPGRYYFVFGGFSYSPAVQYQLQAPLSIEYGQFFKGTRLKLSISPNININKHLYIQTSWQANYLNFKKENATDWIHIVQLKFNWAMNLHLSGSLIGQYNSISNRVFLNTRLRYNFSDGHDLHLVFNQDKFTEQSLSTPQIPPFNNQNFTLKYIYTFAK